jgi:hypothetical protein
MYNITINYVATATTSVWTASPTPIMHCQRSFWISEVAVLPALNACIRLSLLQLHSPVRLVQQLLFRRINMQLMLGLAKTLCAVLLLLCAMVS